MEVLTAVSWFLVGVTVIVFSSLLAGAWERRRCVPGTTKKLPPGPFPLPLVGNLFQLGDKPFLSLARLAQTYGPLISLKLGSATVVVISSSEAAREAIRNNDSALSGRWIPDCLHVRRHPEVSVVWISAGQLWRNLRRFYNAELFTPQKLDASKTLRAQKVKDMVEFVGRRCELGQAVNIGRAAFVTTLNLLSNVIFSVDVIDINGESSHSQAFKDLMWEIMEEAGSPNISDFFPLIRLLDLQGRRRRMARLFEKLRDVFDEMIKLRKLEGDAARQNSDVLDAFLRSGQFDLDTVRSAFTDIFVAGSDTTSATIEWTMAELLRHPRVMTKARSELAAVIGLGKEVDESDITRLPYLQAVVKETMRLHPAVPLLVPHRAEASVELLGHAVPKDARVLFNAWAIGRDPETWKEPESFLPERFLGSEVDFRGRDFELIPFGAGRRICPGLPLAFRMSHLVLASLLLSFDWKLPEGVLPSGMDMGEKVGLSMSLASPLLAVPIKC